MKSLVTKLNKNNRNIHHHKNVQVYKSFLIFQSVFLHFIFKKAHAHNNVLPEFDLSNDIMVNNVPNGVWEDSDAGIMYPDLQDFEDYQRNGIIKLILN